MSLPNVSALSFGSRLGSDRRSKDTRTLVDFSVLKNHKCGGEIRSGPDGGVLYIPRPIWSFVRSDDDPNKKVEADSITQEEFRNGQELIVLNDGYVFDKNALSQWLRTRKTRKSPLSPSYNVTDRELSELGLTPEDVDPSVGQGDLAFTQHWQANMTPGMAPPVVRQRGFGPGYHSMRDDGIPHTPVDAGRQLAYGLEFGT